MSSDSESSLDMQSYQERRMPLASPKRKRYSRRSTQRSVPVQSSSDQDSSSSLRTALSLPSASEARGDDVETSGGCEDRNQKAVSKVAEV
jgi:hypothetical protein